MNWLYYLLEANLYLVLFYGFYRLFLQNETFYNLNRYFLLLSTLISFALPILQLGFLKPSFEKINGDQQNGSLHCFTLEYKYQIELLCLARMWQ